MNLPENIYNPNNYISRSSLSSITQIFNEKYERYKNPMAYYNNAFALGANRVAFESKQYDYIYDAFLSHSWGLGGINHEKLKDLLARSNTFRNHFKPYQNQTEKNLELLKKQLKISELQIKIFFDEFEIGIGEEFLSVIQEALKKTKFFFICLTTDYNEKLANGAKNYCQLEFDYWIDEIKRPKDILIIVMDEAMLDTNKWADKLQPYIGQKILSFINHKANEEEIRSEIENFVLERKEIITEAFFYYFCKNIHFHVEKLLQSIEMKFSNRRFINNNGGVFLHTENEAIKNDLQKFLIQFQFPYDQTNLQQWINWLKKFSFFNTNTNTTTPHQHHHHHSPKVIKRFAVCCCENIAKVKHIVIVALKLVEARLDLIYENYRKFQSLQEEVLTKFEIFRKESKDFFSNKINSFPDQIAIEKSSIFQQIFDPWTRNYQHLLVDVGFGFGAAAVVGIAAVSAAAAAPAAALMATAWAYNNYLSSGKTALEQSFLKLFEFQNIIQYYNYPQILMNLLDKLISLKTMNNNTSSSSIVLDDRILYELTTILVPSEEDNLLKENLKKELFLTSSSSISQLFDTFFPYLNELYLYITSANIALQNCAMIIEEKKIFYQEKVHQYFSRKISNLLEELKNDDFSNYSKLSTRFAFQENRHDSNNDDEIEEGQDESNRILSSEEIHEFYLTGSEEVLKKCIEMMNIQIEEKLSHWNVLETWKEISFDSNSLDFIELQFIEFNEILFTDDLLPENNQGISSAILLFLFYLKEFLQLKNISFQLKIFLMNPMEEIAKDIVDIISDLSNLFIQLSELTDMNIKKLKDDKQIFHLSSYGNIVRDLFLFHGINYKQYQRQFQKFMEMNFEFPRILIQMNSIYQNKWNKVIYYLKQLEEIVVGNHHDRDEQLPYETHSYFYQINKILMEIKQLSPDILFNEFQGSYQKKSSESTSFLTILPSTAIASSSSSNKKSLTYKTEELTTFLQLTNFHPWWSKPSQLQQHAMMNHNHLLSIQDIFIEYFNALYYLHEQVDCQQILTIQSIDKCIQCKKNAFLSIENLKLLPHLPIGFYGFVEIDCFHSIRPQLQELPKLLESFYEFQMEKEIIDAYCYQEFYKRNNILLKIIEQIIDPSKNAFSSSSASSSSSSSPPPPTSSNPSSLSSSGCSLKELIRILQKKITENPFNYSDRHYQKKLALKLSSLFQELLSFAHKIPRNFISIQDKIQQVLLSFSDFLSLVHDAVEDTRYLLPATSHLPDSRSSSLDQSKHSSVDHHLFGDEGDDDVLMSRSSFSSHDNRDDHHDDNDNNHGNDNENENGNEKENGKEEAPITNNLSTLSITSLLSSYLWNIHNHNNNDYDTKAIAERIVLKIRHHKNWRQKLQPIFGDEIEMNELRQDFIDFLLLSLVDFQYILEKFLKDEKEFLSSKENAISLSTKIQSFRREIPKYAKQMKKFETEGKDIVYEKEQKRKFI